MTSVLKGGKHLRLHREVTGGLEKSMEADASQEGSDASRPERRMRGFTFLPCRSTCRSRRLFIHRLMSSSQVVDKNAAQTPYPDTGKEAARDAPLAIEAGPSSGSNEIHVGGDTVALASLGPIVLNVDGTMSRVSNWHEMTEPERCATKRMIVKRNDARRKDLLAKGVKVGQSFSN